MRIKKQIISKKNFTKLGTKPLTSTQTGLCHILKNHFDWKIILPKPFSPKIHTK